jgi:valyl-tRNA synthetase
MAYDWKATEPKWQKFWKEQELWKFDFNSNKPIYSIDNPPPYASGALHIGRATAYTLIDFAARYKRLRGYNVFFPLCFDVNGTPIEVRVEKEHGITKKDIDRHEFIRMCSEYADDNIKRMTHEFEILGESMDPSIYYRTDAEYYRKITQISFLKMYDRDLIYKGEAPVNWCPRCITALADAEVEYKDRATKLNFLKFKIEGKDEFITIATTRPELLCTCQLIAVNPNDPDKNYLAGMRATTPLFERTVEIVEDDKVDPEFGTGVVMICTIGDKDDLEWVFKYNLPIDMGIDEEGKMTELAGKYAGLPIMEARKMMIEDMEAQDLIIKQEDLDQSVGSCWRCQTPIEFLQVEQWFLKMLPYKGDVLKLADKINWYPEFMKLRLEDWINSLQWDWVLSRQRYFATPIPIWECEKCNYIVTAKEEQCYVDPTKDPPPIAKCPECGGRLKGCEDVFDTWMDSSISPLFNTFWMRDEKNFNMLYPMSLRPQAHDIIRTWAYYTMLRCMLITDKEPWTDIMIHGYIMAPDGKPMHTSLGNIIDPLPILNEHGADAFRYYAASCSLGEDHAFLLKEVVHGRRFCTKLWNVERFVGELVNEKPAEPDELHVIDKWILSRYTEVLENVTEYLDGFQYNKAMKEIEGFLWHEFADHYIEMVKHRIYENKDHSAQFTLYTIGLGLIKMLAPILPHITEEIFDGYYKSFEGGKSIHIANWPITMLKDEEAKEKGEIASSIVSSIRNWKSSQGMPLNTEIDLVEIVALERKDLFEDTKNDILKTIRAKNIVIIEKADLEEKAVSIKPIHSQIGPEFKQNAKEIVSNLKDNDPGAIHQALSSGGYEIELSNGETVKLTEEFVEVEKALISHGKQVESIRAGEFLVLISK